MTRQQIATIARIEAAHEVQRFEASQASREQAELDAVSVYYAVQVKIAEGRIEEARALVAAWRASQKGQ